MQEQEIKKRGRPITKDKALIKPIRFKQEKREFLNTLKNYSKFINEIIENTPEYKNYVNSKINTNPPSVKI